MTERLLNAFRPPGPTGVFLVESGRRRGRDRFFRWEGWPANDNGGDKGRRRDLDRHYVLMRQGKVPR